MDPNAAVTISADYGYCVWVAILSVFFMKYLAIKVGMMRKKAGIPYPTMYSDKNKLFNCYQRAHQNTLEDYPLFLVLLLLGGLYCGKLSAIGGMVWLAGRLVYAHGYYTGDPAKRNRGVFAYLGFFIMLYCAVREAGGLLGCF